MPLEAVPPAAHTSSKSRDSGPAHTSLRTILGSGATRPPPRRRPRRRSQPQFRRRTPRPSVVHLKRSVVPTHQTLAEAAHCPRAATPRRDVSPRGRGRTGGSYTSDLGGTVGRTTAGLASVLWSALYPILYDSSRDSAPPAARRPPAPGSPPVDRRASAPLDSTCVARTPSRHCLRALTRRVDSLTAASTASRRRGVARTPSTRS